MISTLYNQTIADLAQLQEAELASISLTNVGSMHIVAVPLLYHSLPK